MKCFQAVKLCPSVEAARWSPSLGVRAFSSLSLGCRSMQKRYGVVRGRKKKCAVCARFSNFRPFSSRNPTIFHITATDSRYQLSGRQRFTTYPTFVNHQAVKMGNVRSIQPPLWPPPLIRVLVDTI